MPGRELKCYVAMLPVLKSDDALRMYRAVACGVGPRSNKQKRILDGYLQEWKDAVKPYAPKVIVRRARNPEEAKAMLASMGIRVKES